MSKFDKKLVDSLTLREQLYAASCVLKDDNIKNKLYLNMCVQRSRLAREKYKQKRKALGPLPKSKALLLNVPVHLGTSEFVNQLRQYLNREAWTIQVRWRGGVTRKTSSVSDLLWDFEGFTTWYGYRDTFHLKKFLAEKCVVYVTPKARSGFTYCSDYRNIYSQLAQDEVYRLDLLTDIMAKLVCNDNTLDKKAKNNNDKK